MECLTGSSLNGVCSNKIIDQQKGLILCSNDVCLSKKSEICFLGFSSSKFVHNSLLSVQHKIIQPISCVHHPLQLSSDTQEHTQSEEADTTDTNQTTPVRVKFQLYKECSFGQHFHIVGNDPMLGSWNPSNAVPLDWSEGHVWSVELDIPSGKTISYKFIMKGDAETVLWQEGPDRILQTWETKNTISVSEDWDNAELQEVVEEEPVAEQVQESEVNAVLVAENLIPPTVVDVEDDVNNEKTKEVLAIVADNITEANEETPMLVADEKVPVFVPGLPQVLTSEVHIEKVVVESSLGSNNEEFNVLLDEAQINKVVAEDSIGLKSEELSSTDELATDLTRPNETTEMTLNVKQDVSANDDIEKSEYVEEEDWSNVKLMEENVFESDIQWGKRTLQKFFASLGFCKVELKG